jgi:hypothetical protein
MACKCPGDAAQVLRRNRFAALIGRAHQAGALSQIAAQLGDLQPGKLSYEPSVLDAEAQSFDGRLNAWMEDYQAAANVLPQSLIDQIDAFIQRWRDFKDSFYFFTGARGAAILQYEADFNRFHDQVASYTGKASAVAPSTVTVDGKPVRADQVPDGVDTISRIETIAKWGALLLAGGVAVKIASDVGAFKALGQLGHRKPATATNPRRRRRRRSRRLGATKRSRSPSPAAPP